MLLEASFYDQPDAIKAKKLSRTYEKIGDIEKARYSRGWQSGEDMEPPSLERSENFMGILMHEFLDGEKDAKGRPIGAARFLDAHREQAEDTYRGRAESQEEDLAILFKIAESNLPILFA